ncbi:hypothetical protein LCGC14_2488830 [marine sediment metagenome]|uniref:Uncharacterized protein n=1 Tax=marine sediment metagenome TaxID=412755 RepID=A0A0F9B630_9ZZZZ
MARYKLSETEIERKVASNSFTDREIGSYAQATMFLEEPYHFVENPDIDHKIVLSPFKKDTITIYSNTNFSKDQRDAALIGDAEIIDLCNTFFPDLPERKTVVEIFIADNDVVIMDGILLDPKLIEEKIEPELEFIVGLSNHKDKKTIEDYIIITEENVVKYVNEDSIGKLFIPFMGDWFDNKFPGVMVSDDADDAQKLTEMKEWDLTEIDERMKKANDAIELQYKYKRKEELATDVLEMAKNIEKYVADMDQIKKEKTERIKNSKLPIEGLTFDGDNIYFNDIIFEECSTAERIEIALAVAVEEDPNIRVLLIREGSNLDESAVKRVKKLAKENNFQIWIESVHDLGQNAIYIEDGEIKNQ